MLDETDIINIVLTDLGIQENDIDKFDMQYLKQHLAREIKDSLSDELDSAYSDGQASRDDDVDTAEETGYDEGVQDLKEKIADVVSNKIRKSENEQEKVFWEKVEEKLDDILYEAELKVGLY